MKGMRIPLMKGTTGENIASVSPARTVNMYPLVDPLTKRQGSWKNTPGWEALNYDIFSDNEFISATAFSDYVILVDKAGGVYKWLFPHLFNLEFLGTVDSVDDLYVAEDGINLLITTGRTMYIHPKGTSSLSIVTTAMARPTNVIFHNGHFIAVDKGKGQFFISDKFDGSTWDAKQFATAEDKPDKIVGLGSDRNLLIFGEYTTQVYDTRAELFPFQPNQQGRMVYGMVGRTWALVSNVSYWLSSNVAGNVKVLRSSGLQPQVVSTPFIEAEFSKFNTDKARAFSIMWEGREWYVLTFPEDGRTFVYDVQGLWFEWLDWDNSKNEFTNHPMLDFLYIKGDHIFVDGTRYPKRLRGDVYTHDGKPMVTYIQSGVIHADERRIFLSKVELDMLAGVGGEVEISVSYDGGQTWGYWQPTSLGDKLDTYHRVQWWRLGSGRNLVIRIRITDPVPREIVDAIVEINLYRNREERARHYKAQAQ